MAIKVYTLSGEFTGHVIGSGIFKVEPEGIGLYARGDGGHWIATDLDDTKTVFHIFDRKNLKYLGSFSGRETANTDGICVTSRALASLPGGAVFAIHDDSAVSAFSGEEIWKKFHKQ